MSGRSFSSFRLGGLDLYWPQLFLSISFPVQLNPCLALCFLRFLFGPCSFPVTTRRTQPWPLPAALPCVPALWHGLPRVLPSLLAWWIFISPWRPSQCFTNGKLFLAGASSPWCLWALILDGVFSCRRFHRQQCGQNMTQIKKKSSSFYWYHRPVALTFEVIWLLCRSLELRRTF